MEIDWSAASAASQTASAPAETGTRFMSSSESLVG
jgi:hypothetical protein